MAQRTAVYRAFDAEGRLLYVGMTNNVERRMREHQSYGDWWPRYHRHSVEWFDCRRDARIAESRASREEDPEFNRDWISAENAGSQTIRDRVGGPLLPDAPLAIVEGA